VPSESVQAVRRFVLGRQGLWPGRRWAGPRGVERALRYVDSVQVDPLDVVGHNQDQALWGRIDGYRLRDLEDALYRRRSVFEWGGNVQIRPIEELPYLGMVMQRKVGEERWQRFARANAPLLIRVIREITDRGPLGPRDFEGDTEVKIRNYRARKAAGLALYYLWLKGDLMVAARRRGEKVFDLTARLFPRQLPAVPTKEAEEHLVLQTLRDLGIATSSQWLAYAHTRIGRSTLRRDWTGQTHRWEEQGVIRKLEVLGWNGPRWVLTEAASDLATVHASGVPSGWRPRSTTTEEEAVFLAPLEFATARGRALQLFGFEYLWEVYKPASARRWGYYTLPVLYEDRLPARIELRFDRTSSSLRVLGFWPEEPAIRRDPTFAGAFGNALARLADLHAAKDLDLSGLHSPRMQSLVMAAARSTRDGGIDKPAS
jgi:uncharacterized protein